ncbi:hypothetical protein K438DRAFT_1562345 [Mycena galopus ATCC 62051]|nr:hypothetical protein K438DRAFT_1562345 [Mycena galopus ATCC 62051]
MVPVLWDRSLPDADAEYATALKSYPRRLENWQIKVSQLSDNAKAPPRPKEPVRRMQAGEDENFLRFATALKIMVGSAIRTEAISKAKKLLRQYLLTYLELYGAESMKPNQHWAVHIPEEIEDFGPVYSFWAFLSERLNKILKNLKSNNWTGGHVEVSMMRQFHRSSKLDAQVKI